MKRSRIDFKTGALIAAVVALLAAGVVALVKFFIGPFLPPEPYDTPVVITGGSVKIEFNKNDYPDDPIEPGRKPRARRAKIFEMYVYPDKNVGKFIKYEFHRRNGIRITTVTLVCEREGDPNDRTTIIVNDNALPQSSGGNTVEVKFNSSRIPENSSGDSYSTNEYIIKEVDIEHTKDGSSQVLQCRSVSNNGSDNQLVDCPSSSSLGRNAKIHIVVKKNAGGNWP